MEKVPDQNSTPLSRPHFAPAFLPFSRLQLEGGHPMRGVAHITFSGPAVARVAL